MLVESTSLNGTAHPAAHSDGQYCPWPKAQDVGRFRAMARSSAAADPRWPSATVSLCERANQRIIRECAEHARITKEHADSVRAYVDLLGTGAHLTCRPAQDLAFDIVHLEQQLRVIEESLVGRYDDGR